MIDGGAERFEQEFMSYLLARPHTMPSELAHTSICRIGQRTIGWAAW